MIRLKQNSSFEKNICGIDEVGRGSLAGPLVVAGVCLLKNITKLKDSKKLSLAKRRYFYDIIVTNSLFQVVFVDNNTIDKIGISKAMKYSILKIVGIFKKHNIIIDGNNNFGVPNIKPIIKADNKISHVSAASIIAKVKRDNYLIEMDKKFPKYGLATNKGYGTKKHIESIRKFGYSDFHRKSFKVKIL